MKLVNDFYGDFSAEYRAIYFPNEKHGYTDNKDYWNAKEITELFKNGCINYNQFIVKLAEYCSTSALSIGQLMSKYIVNK